MGILDFEQSITFYGQYHNNPWNKILHLIGVPTISFTVIIWLSQLPIPYVTDLLADYLSVKASTAVVLLYMIYYILLEPIAGVLYAPFLMTMLYGADLFILSYPENWFPISLAIHIAAWLTQLVGHAAFEGRSPALLDNLAQAFLMAPFFVFLEVLFYFGYRPLLHRRINAKVLKAINEWKQQNKSQTVSGKEGKKKAQ